MKDIYNILGVSEDDIVIELRYCVIYALRKDILDLSEDWARRPIIARFKDYTHQNAIRINNIAFDNDDCIVFDLRLVDPDVAIQDIIDDISDVLIGLLPWPAAIETEYPWREVKVFTVGDSDLVNDDIKAYIEALRKSKPEDG